VAKRLRYSRWRRLPGAYRIGERKPPDPGQEEQRLMLYLPAAVLDAAEALARRAGAPTLQRYCEDVLRQRIEEERNRLQLEQLAARRGPLEGLDAIANDPEYLAELSASSAPHPRPAAPEAIPEVFFPDPEPRPLPAPPPPTSADAAEVAGSAAAEVVLRHAALVGDDPSAVLASLRRGEAINPDAAHELLKALIDLEVATRDARQLDRRLAFALHRLAFEGQVLLTDAWPGQLTDAATVDVLRLIQEAVDRILSGEDIRYYSRGPGPGPAG
jgi:hypothetical protein